MKFFKYGIILERLKEDDIELVREWRNSDPVRLNMNFQEIISPEQQLEWFRSINTPQFNYLMIHYKGEKIGLLNDKNIDWDSRSSESGIFIGRTEYHNTSVPFLVSVAGIESNFYLMGWKKQYAHILRTNTNAIQFNLQLGYRLCKGQEDEVHQRYELTLDSFGEKAVKIRKAVRSIAGDDILASILFEPADYETGLAQKFEALLNASQYPLQRTLTREGTWFRETGPDVTRK